MSRKMADEQTNNDRPVQGVIRKVDWVLRGGKSVTLGVQSRGRWGVNARQNFCRQRHNSNVLKDSQSSKKEEQPSKQEDSMLHSIQTRQRITSSSLFLAGRRHVEEEEQRMEHLSKAKAQVKKRVKLKKDEKHQKESCVSPPTDENPCDTNIVTTLFSTTHRNTH